MKNKKLIHFITISFLILLAESGCPSTCNCKNISVLCIEADLECVPNFDSLTNNPVVIDLSGNKISYIHVTDLSFEKSNETKELYLNNSEVVSISEHSFDELENLQELYLASNLLTSISEYIIEKLDSICLLDLSNNYFTSFPKIRSASLEVLPIANSKISTIPVDALDHLPNLRILILERNNIQYIDPAAFAKLETALMIRLNHNPWHCNCETVKLFNNLAQKNLIANTEMIRCVTGSNYTDLYKNGVVVKQFVDLCSTPKNHVFSADIIVNPTFGDSIQTQIEEEKKDAKQVHKSTGGNYNVYVLVVCLLAVFSIGVIFGSVLNIAINKKRQIESTESTIKLMT